MKPRRQPGKGAFDLIEEAVHLLRTAPAATLAVYYLGAMPFVLGLLYFWTDMSRSPFAAGHLSGASLGMAALFLWMKFWQAVFAGRVRAQLAAEPPPGFGFRQCLQIFTSQTILQPLGLLLIGLFLAAFFLFAPLGLLLAPFVFWLLSLFQNVTALAGGGDGVKSVFKNAWRQWQLWPGQNIVLLAILALFGFYAFLNWITACFMLPGLLKMLFGIQTVFTESPLSLLNSSFFAGMFGLTYLCVDPILKTVYALRCFYGQSLQSGEDLKAELKSFSFPPQKIAAAILIFLTLWLAMPARSENATAPSVLPAPQKISPPDLDKAISQTIRQSKYSWRMPRDKIAAADSREGILGKFFDQIGQTLRRWARAFLDWLDRTLKKLFHDRRTTSASHASGYGWIMSVEILLYSLVAVVVAALAIFLYRLWRDRGKLPAAVAAEAIQSAPDLADENVGADQLPEDGWTTLARELLARGEFRLAMRAFYLASLSHLAARNLIRVARFKSNRDYERELRRRAHAFPNLLSVFGDNVSVFERIWYGTHEVNGELVNQFSANVEKIKAAG
jgi:Domain of unknown function (DUF4129)